MCAHRAEIVVDDVQEVKAVCFRGFEDLPEDEHVDSPQFQCLGHSWNLGIIVDSVSVSATRRVDVLLHHSTPDSIDIEFCITVRNSAREEVARYGPRTEHFTGFECDDFAETHDFARRSTLIPALVDGALTVEVMMRKIASGGSAPARVFVPENPLPRNILKQFLVEESADITFEVAGEDGRSGGEHERARTSPTVFHAHRSVLQHGAPTLADLCTPGGGGPVTAQITGVRPEAFRLLLYYAYGGEIAADELAAHARDLVDAADQYGLASLKLEAEASYVQSTTLTIDNVLDTLFYAHSKNCALLQEAVMDFVVQNADLVVDKVSFNDFPGSIVNDVLVAVARGRRGEDASEADCYSSMRVGDLRTMLHEKGLEVDGSREAMIALLKEHP